MVRAMSRFPATQPVLVTGATGFVGANLVRRLLTLGCEPHILVRAKTNWWRLADIRTQLRVHEVDLLDFERLGQVVSAVRPRVIYHLATHGAYPTQTDADRVIRTDILGTWNLLRACSRVDYMLFVNTGSSSEYGAKPHAMRETDLLEPNSYYAVAKSAQTLLCQHVARAEQRPINTLRLFSVYGPYEEPSRLFPTIITRALAGRALEMVAPETARDFVYLDDVIDAYLRVEPLSAQVGGIFNIGTGVQSTLRDVVEAVLKATGVRVAVNWGRMPPRTWDAATWVADCAAARRVLTWVPKTRLEEGVRKTVEWFKQRAVPVSEARIRRRPRKARSQTPVSP